MAAFKNKDNGTWYVQFRYTDWKGERQQKLKRGFATKMCIRDRPVSKNNRNGPCAAAENQSKFKYWEVTTMRKILSCEFNLDTACVELRLDDGTLLSIDCTAVENELANSMYQRSELDWLIYNDPLAYAELILNGEPELYLKVVTNKTPLG